MEAHAQLMEAARLIGRMVDLAAAPARREVVRLSVEAEPIREQRVAADARAAAAVARAQHLGWLPFYGPRLRTGAVEAQAAADDLARSWGRMRARARDASDLLALVKRAKQSVACAEARARLAGPVSAGVAERIGELLVRTRFLEGTEGRDAARSHGLAPKAFRLAAVAENIARAWGGVGPVGAAPPRQQEASAAHNRPLERARPGKARQLALDFDGTGQVEEDPRIWLPVSPSRAKEFIARGARLDREASRRGSQLWIPVSERHKVETALPLAFRRQTQPFAFPPIRHNAVGQNLWSVFDKPSWNHIRTTAYDRAGHRCMICGKQGGNLWKRLADPDEALRGGLVDCHEVWEWEVIDEQAGIGVQKLKRLLVVCKDCHMLFHEGFAMYKAREAGIAQDAADYIKSLRMLVNRTDGPGLESQIALDHAAWDQCKDIGTWVLDLSHLAAQDFMADHTMVLQSGNRAGVGPAQIGGIAFSTDDGTAFAAQDAHALAVGDAPRPLAAPIRPGGRI